MERNKPGRGTGSAGRHRAKRGRPAARGTGAAPRRQSGRGPESGSGTPPRPRSRAEADATSGRTGRRVPDSTPARSRRSAADLNGVRETRTAQRSAGARRGSATRDDSGARGSTAGRASQGSEGQSKTGPRGRGRHRAPGRKSIPARLAGISPRTVILLILLVVFIVLSVSPVTRNLEATGNLKRMQAELKKEKAVTESLEKQVEEARSVEYVEAEARKQHLVAPGEIPYLVTTDQPGGEIKYRVKALQSMEEAWVRVMQMLHSVPRQQ